MGRPLDPKVVPYSKKDGSTSYRVRLRVNGRQTTETFTSLPAAEAFVANVKDPAIGPERAIEMRDRLDAQSPGYVPTVAEALEHHVAGLTGVQSDTRAEYLAVARRSWLPRLGRLRVDELSRRDIADWVNTAEGAVSPKTIKNAHAVLTGVLTWAVNEGHVSANVARGTRLPRAGEEDEEDIKFLTHAEFDLLYREFPPDRRPMLVWMFGMGTRFSETTAMWKREVNLAAGMTVGDDWVSTPQARIVRSWKKNGKLGPPKSKASRRTVVMPPEVVDVVEPLLAAAPTGDTLLFRTPGGARVTHSNFFNRVWKPATMRASICEDHRVPKCRCLGPKPYECPVHTAVDAKGVRVLPEPCGCPGTLPFRPRIHDARHTHASWLIEQGVRLDVVRDRLGHEDLLTTMRLYAHLMPDARVAAGAAASLAFASTQLRAPSPPELPAVG